MTAVTQCQDCGLPLTNAESQRLGYGRSCAEKRGLIPPRRRRQRAAPRRKPAPVPHAPDTIPGQDALALFEYQPTLWSL